MRPAMLFAPPFLLLLACARDGARVATLDAAVLKSNVTADTTVVLRRIAVDSAFYQAISPDGRHAASFDFSVNTILISDIRSGTRRTLDLRAATPGPKAYVEYMLFSSDGKKLAFAWSDTRPPGRAETLNVIGIDGTGERQLLRTSDALTYFELTDWSVDGRQFLALLYASDKSHQIATISATDGTVRVLRSLDWRVPGGLKFSPDGRMVAYDFQPKQDAATRDVVVLDLVANREMKITNDVQSKRLVGWSPDGRSLFYLTENGSAKTVWRAPLKNGSASGAPVSVRADIFGMGTIGFVNGALYYYVSEGKNAVSTVAVDFTSGRALGPPTSVATGTDVFVNGSVLWSPDGNRLALIRKSESEVSTQASLAICDVATRQERRIPLGFERARVLEWLPDGKTVLINAVSRGQSARYSVDLTSGKIESEGVSARVDGAGRRSPDGKFAYRVGEHVGSGATPDSVDLVVQNLETKETRVLFRDRGITSLELSPDGTTLAFLALDPDATQHLVLLPSAGGTARHVRAGLPSDLEFASLSWTPDSRFVALLYPHGTPSKTEVWRVTAQSGAAQRILILGSMQFSPRVSPDGRRLAFIGFSAVAQTLEYWVMENLAGSRRTIAPPP